jgi:hypothetical protein
MADPNLIHLGLFMASGLSFLAKIVKSSIREHQAPLMPLIDDFINQNKSFGITIKVEQIDTNVFINISYKGIFICRANINDY